MRVMPNMKVVVPCDAIEAKKATIVIAQVWGPVYIRLAREKTPIITTDSTPFTLGKAEIFWDSSDGIKEKDKAPQVCIAACGPLIANALVAAEILEQEDIGGLGSAIAEILATKKPTPMEFVGMQDTFGESGNPWELVEKYGLSAKDIVQAVKRVIKKK